MTKNLSSYILGGIVLALLAVILYQSLVPAGLGSKDKVAEQAITFIKEELAGPDTEISLTGVSEKHGVYEVEFDIMGQNEKVYVTKDAKFLFLQPFDMQPPEPQGFTKTDVPNANLFVMSYCPYGNQAEELMIPVAELLGDKANVELHYILYSNYASGYPEYCYDEEEKYCSMHGIQELNQGVRELCVQKYQKDKLWDFVKAANEQATYEDIDSKWETIAQSVGVDVAQVKTCEAEEIEALLAQELALTQESYPVQDPSNHQGAETERISGSPTLTINGMIFDGDRSADAYKEAICSAFINLPDECSQELTSSSSPSSGMCE